MPSPNRIKSYAVIPRESIICCWNTHESGNLPEQYRSHLWKEEIYAATDVRRYLRTRTEITTPPVVSNITQGVSQIIQTGLNRESAVYVQLACVFRVNSLQRFLLISIQSLYVITGIRSLTGDRSLILQRLPAWHSCFLYYRQFRKFVQRLVLLGIIGTGDSLVAAENQVVGKLFTNSLECRMDIHIRLCVTLSPGIF